MGGLPAPTLGQVPPDGEWRTIRSDHFRVTFPATLEALGRRAVDRAERAYLELAQSFVQPPSGVIDIVVTDHVDVTNGFAQATPSNRITVFARPPVDDVGLSYNDDWLELVITHELAHIVHLDRTTNPAGKLLRGVFGRQSGPWPFFPGSGTPGWVIEGLATWYESQLTNAGRVKGTYHEMILRTAVLEGRFESIGQASGRSPVWPSGTRDYAYGSMFFDHLLRKHGEDRMAVFVDAIAGQWTPYRLDSAGRKAFGVSLSDEWQLWELSLRDGIGVTETSIERIGDVSAPESVTQGARWGWYPKVSPDGSRVAYLRSDGRSDSQVEVAAPDGSGRSMLTRTNGLATFDWLPDGGLLFAQVEYVDRYRIFGDLYRAAPDGSQSRLTRGARLDQPAVGAGGDWAVAIQDGGGTNAVVRVDLRDGSVRSLVEPEPDVHWAFPRPSPDGRWIAATRFTPGAHHDVVLLDAAGGVVSRVTSDRAVDLAPAWSPDGRWVVWGSDRTGILNVLAAEVDSTTGSVGAPKMLTNVLTGALFPSVDPSGHWLYFTAYHVDGWEVERLPFEPGSAPPAPDADARFAEGPTADWGSSDLEVRDYSPWSTLRPRYWEVVSRNAVQSGTSRSDNLFLRNRTLLGTALGAETSGRDLVGRHSFGAIGRVYTSGGKYDGGVSYSFAGLGNPVLSVAANQLWTADRPTVGRRTPDAPLDTLFVLERERTLSASVGFGQRGLRRDAFVTLSGGMVWEDRELLDNALQPSTTYRLTRPGRKLADFRASFSLATSRSHSFTVGAARGASLFLTGRTRGEFSMPDSLVGVDGFDGSLRDVQGRARLFHTIGGPGFSGHVIALQGSFGVANGPGAGAGHFDVGGAAGSRESIGSFSFFGGGSIFFPVRGYSTSARFGRNAWSTSAEYRVPLALVNQGLGAWPAHLDRVLGSVFFDAGNAWGPDVTSTGFRNPLQRALMSVGAELTSELLVGFRVAWQIRTGVAFPLVDGSGANLYLRLGLPF